LDNTPYRGDTQKAIKFSEVTKMYEDKTLTCKECGAEFVFTAGEQEFYAEKGFTNEPCSQCGGVARVPFKPRDDRAVLCSECFAKSKA